MGYKVEPDNSGLSSGGQGRQRVGPGFGGDTKEKTPRAAGNREIPGEDPEKSGARGIINRGEPGIC
jgi:hypothetical protein